ncbi:phosphotransferase [Hoeflea sp. AS60]|uniref:phosphotransferase n=1 Tax=Hoeflea sp. AS60 TaxID=3135780 RepID=UPI00318126B8
MAEVSALTVSDMISFCQAEIGDGSEVVERRNQLFQKKEPFALYESRKYSYRIFGANAIKALVQGDHLKVKELQAILADRRANSVLAVMPKHIMNQPFGAYGFVNVSELPVGEKKTKLGPEEIEQLGRFLSELHEVKRFKTVNETGFQDSGEPDFSNYVVSAALVYRQMLYPDLDHEARRLVDDAVEFIKRTAGNDKSSKTESVIVHKDIFEDKLYWKAGKLSTVDGWEAAQTAPREWELAVIWNRFPDDWEYFISCYGAEHDRNLLKLCGAVQALRFWKSFRAQGQFVSQQVTALRKSMTV